MRVTIRPHNTVFSFLSIWYAFLVSIPVIALALRPARDLSTLLLCAAPVALAAVSWMLTRAVFEAEFLWLKPEIEGFLQGN